MTKFLTTARLWVALRLSLALHFASESFRSVAAWLSKQARTAYWRYLVVCVLVFPVFVLVCLVSAVVAFAEEVLEFIQHSVYGRSRWKREVAKFQPTVPAPSTGGVGGGSIGVNPPKQAR